MKRHIWLLAGLFCLFYLEGVRASDSFTVLQLNLWQGGSKVPGGPQGIVDVLNQVDADVVFLCEINGGQQFMEQLLSKLKSNGKSYYGETLGMDIGILSKFKPDTIRKGSLDSESNARPMLKMVATINGQSVSFYACHLDYTHYECYMPRGYSGTSWKKIEHPITDEQTVLEANRQSSRDESIRAFLREVQADIKNGRPVIMGGDFNEPSHLDWGEETKKLWDHNEAVIRWDCSRMLQEAGLKDSYRQKYPNAVKYPGFTFPAGNRDAVEKELSWAPEADERDRIDFIYYHPLNNVLSLKKIQLVGPVETVIRGKIAEKDSKDKILTPACVWPSDHKGNLATFNIRGK